MFRRAAVAATLSLLLVPAAASAAHAHGSDSPTPYHVTSTGIELPAGARLGDDADVNVHWTNGGVTHSSALHTGHRGDRGHRYATAHTLTWAELGVPTGACVTWVQVSGYDEHFGEGGQKPVCVTPPPQDCPRGTPSPTPTPTPRPTPSSTPTPPAPQPTPPAHHHPTRPTPSAPPSPTHPTTPAPQASTPVVVPSSPAPSTTPQPPVSTPASTASTPRGGTPGSQVEGEGPTASAAPSPVSDDSPTPSASPTAYVLADDDATLATTGGDARGPAALAGALVVLGAATTLVARARNRRGAQR